MNIAIINQGGSKYLFEVPESITLKEGEKVKCDTRRGVKDGVVWADSITTDEPTAKLIGKLLGAKFPLKSVVGKSVTSVEMFEQPKQEDKPKFKVGDRVKVVKTDYGHKEYQIGKIYEIKNLQGQHNGDFKYGVGETFVAFESELEPYTEPETAEPKQEPEKAEPEYLNMRVVCVDDGNCGCCWIVGAPYKVINGEIRDKDGERMLNNVTSLDDLNSRLSGKFIEFKGE